VKKIPLTRDKFAIVDDADCEYLNQWKWLAHKKPGTDYVEREENGRTILMSRQIMNLDFGDCREVDHINGNGLDNRRCNLRICTRRQNQMNRRKHKGKSCFKGVGCDGVRRKWRARIRVGGRLIHLGRFENEIDAAEAYDKAALQYFDEFACTNFDRQLIQA